MFVAWIVASALATPSSAASAPLAVPTATPQPAATTAAAPTAVPAAAPSGAPLREVVYKVTTVLRIDDITESFGGGSGAVPPVSSGSESTHGTVTVDVMTKFADGSLGIRLTEVWVLRHRAVSYSAVVTPNGTVELDLSAMDNIGLELLPYFGTHFVPTPPLDASSRWSVNLAGAKSSVETDYTVTAINGAVVTLHKQQVVKALGSESVDGSIVYEPLMLAPVSGYVRTRMTEMYANGQTTGTLELRFERESDTAKPSHI